MQLEFDQESFQEFTLKKYSGMKVGTEIYTYKVLSVTL